MWIKAISMVFVLVTLSFASAATNPNPFNVPGGTTTQATPVPIPPSQPVIVTVPAAPQPEPPGILVTILSNLLPIVLAAMGLSISPQLMLIFGKALTLITTIAENRLREKFENIVENGAASAVGDGTKTKEDFFARVVSYVHEHGADTIKRLGVTPNSGVAISAIKAIAEKVLLSGKLPITLPQEPTVVAPDRIAALEDLVRKLLQKKDT